MNSGKSPLSSNKKATSTLTVLLMHVQKCVAVFSLFHVQIHVRPQKCFECGEFVAEIQSFVFLDRKAGRGRLVISSGGHVTL